ncbi:hypothetical protein [Psychrobacillus vulpis]|uniref:hypothetical protein n=1 Tax=Psychrobacillus vulpis TaxID=2325572 RepID=UPI0014081BA5|nr:hypothetical protein [Psychrobacillus vulpis]
MKIVNFIFNLLLITLLIAGCQNTTNKIQEQNDIQDYKPSSEDVVDMHGDIENKEI